MTAPTRKEQLVTRLYALSHDRKALMALRASLSEPTGISTAAYAHIGDLLPGSANGEYDEKQHRMYFQFAGLFALWHTTASRRNAYGNIGSSLRQVGRGISTDALIGVLTRGLPTWQLRSSLQRAVTLCARNNVGLNWQQLLWDMTNTDYRSVQRSWAFSFFYTPSKKSNDQSTAAAFAEATTQEV